jgi:hypothetical protein
MLIDEDRMAVGIEHHVDGSAMRWIAPAVRSAPRLRYIW